MKVLLAWCVTVISVTVPFRLWWVTGISKIRSVWLKEKKISGFSFLKPATFNPKLKGLILMKFQYIFISEESLMHVRWCCWLKFLSVCSDTDPLYEIFSYCHFSLKFTLVGWIFVLIQKLCAPDVLVTSSICHRQDCYKPIIL